jgi:hypothetical protein
VYEDRSGMHRGAWPVNVGHRYPESHWSQSCVASRTQAPLLGHCTYSPKQVVAVAVVAIVPMAAIKASFMISWKVVAVGVLPGDAMVVLTF